MIRKAILVFGAMVSAGLVSSANAGFIAASGSDTFSYGGAGTAVTPASGGTITITDAPLSTYTPDTPADPQILAGDLGQYLFSLNVTVTSAVGGVDQASGTYALFYNLNNGGSPEDIRVSSGSALLFLTPIGGGQSAATGSLTQILGPADPADFRDLAYGNNSNIVLQGGLYSGSNNTLALTLRQNAQVPEPASLGILGLAGLLGMRRRRRV